MSKARHASVVLAGASGDLGGRIAKALVLRGARVRALVRPDAGSAELSRLAALGVQPHSADPKSVEALASGCAGAACVVSALNGVRDAIVDRQTVLLEAAVRAGVPRFIPSDYAADFTKTAPGRNRNYDLRREFMATLDRAPTRATSVLNGAFMDMLGAEMPIIRPRLRRVLYWCDAHQPLDFTTKDDTATYTAAAALDDDAPRILRVAGDVVSAQNIADAMTSVTGRRFRTLRAGGLGALTAMIAVAKLAAPGRGEAFPPWQGMQYMRDQFSGHAKLTPLDNDRYPGLRWTSVRDHLASLEKQ